MTRQITGLYYELVNRYSKLSLLVLPRVDQYASVRGKVLFIAGSTPPVQLRTPDIAWYGSYYGTEAAR